MNKREKNAVYWAQRAKQSQDAILDDVQNVFVPYAQEQYDEAIRRIETQIRAWYQRLAKNNGVTFKEARQLLQKDELAEFHWDVNEYMRHAWENADGIWEKELENASAKVHISQLDALRTRLRQQCEVIADRQISTIGDAAGQTFVESYFHTAFELQKQARIGVQMRGVDRTRIMNALRRPWTTDSSNYVARCWKDKDRLVQVVNRELTQMIATGAKPDRAISTIAKEFGVSKRNAGRLIMTESSHAASEAQAETFRELKVERYQIVATLSATTCEICQKMDGLVFPMSERKEGETAHPFHPNCRCTTRPYDEDVEKFVERIARDAKTGETYRVPGDMTYKQWMEKQDAKYGAGFVSKQRRVKMNEIPDFEQYREIKEVLGEDGPRNFGAFQEMKYAEDRAAYKKLIEKARTRN